MSISRFLRTALLRRLLSLSCLALSILPTTQFVAADILAKPQPFKVGENPNAIAVADFDGDKLPDIVEADGQTGVVRVFLNRGGQFVEASTFSVGMGSVYIATGDFNGDGRPDIAVANAQTGTVHVALGLGDGSFAAPQLYRTGLGTKFVLVTDVDRDGVPDLVAVNAAEKSLTILKGNGDGTFSFGSKFSLEALKGNPVSVAAVDFGGNGVIDLVVANGIGNSVTVLLGDGAGTFELGNTYQITSGHASAVVASDFDGDGIPDIAVSGSNGRIELFLGTGHGEFQRGTAYVVGQGDLSVQVADINADSVPDLVVGGFDTAAVSVLLGNGDGTFRAPARYGESGLSAIAVADFNQDGRLDVAAANSKTGAVEILLNALQPTSTSLVRRLSPSGSSSVVASVSSTSGSPAGSILFRAGGKNLTTVSLDQKASAAIEVPPTGAASTISATYLGDLVHLGSRSGGIAKDHLTAALTSSSPIASITPSPISFAKQVVGVSSSIVVTVKNTGTATLTITSITLSGTNASEFSDKTTCKLGVAIAIGGSCTVTVTSLPTSAGSKSAALTFVDDDPTSPQVVNITGNAVDAPYISIVPSPVKFPPQGVGVASSPLNLTLTNRGDMPLSISGSTISGTAASNYAIVSNNCPSLVPAGANCIIALQFTPSTTGSRAGVLNISSNALNTPYKVTLSGTGINGANAVASPTSLAFGSQGVGVSATQTITVSNTGNATLTIGTPTLGGTNPSDFSFSSGCTTVAVGQSCTITVTFTPPTTGALSATLSIPTSANVLPPISMKGTGVNGPVAQLSSTSVNFGSQTTGQKSAAQTVTLTNTGNAALAISSFTMSGTNAADFQQTNTCPISPATVPLGGSCTISITFTPASVGTRSATLTIKDNGVPTSQKITLTGLGIQGSGGPTITVSLSPTNIQTFDSSTGTVTISAPAPTQGQQVFLSASNPNIITMPTSVTVASGQTTATFTISSSSQAGSEVITGFATGFTSGTANLSIASRTTTLSVSPVVGLGRSVSATLTLATAAPTGGTTFTLSSGDSTVATVSPSTVFVAAGSKTTTTPIQVSGVNLGATSITASASGYTTSSAAVSVTNNLINLGKSLTVAPGQTLPLPVSLSAAAPMGGITVNLTGSTSVATVSPTSVFIPAGQTAPASPPQITGLVFGTATFTGSDASGQFAPDSSLVSVTITLTFSPSTLSVNAGATANLTLSISAPAPANGYTAHLVVASTSIATAPASVSFPAGATTATVPVTGVAAGSTTIQATITGAPSASAAITVNPPPAITLNPTTVGRNLEVPNTGTLAAPAPAGNLNVTLTSSASTRMLLSPDAVTPGTSSITIQVPAGSSTFTYYVQGITSTGTANVTARAPGYANGSAVVTLAPSGFYVATPSVGTAVGVPDSTVTISPATLTPSTLTIAQAPVNLRPGISAAITVTSSATSVGTIIGSPVTLAGGTNYASVAFHPVANGTTNITVVEPSGYSKPATSTSIVATVSTSAFSVGGSVTLGANLQTAVSSQLTTPAPAGNLNVTVTSSDSTKLLLSTDPTVAGSGSITLQVPAGSTTVPTFWTQALGSTANLNVQMQASGVATANFAVAIVPSGFVVVAACDQSSFSTNVVSGDTQLYIMPEPLDPNTLQPTFVNNTQCSGGSSQPLSPGVGPISVNVTSANTSIGTILNSPVSFNTDDTQQLATFHPVAVGSTNVSIDTPAAFTTPAADQQVSGTVTLSNLYLSTSSTGKDLQSQLAVSLGAAAPPGNEQVTITSADPTQVLLTTDPTAAGTPSVSVVVFAGQSTPSVPVYAQALKGTGTVNLTASSPDFGTVTTPIQLVPSGFVVAAGCAGSAISTTPLSPDTQLTVYPVALDPTTLQDTNLISGCYPVGQPVRFGAAPVTVNISTADPGVGIITTSPLTFNAGDTSQTTAFHPVADGNTNVNLAAVTGFTTPANYQQIAATVAAGYISVTVPDLGKNLQSSVAVSLSTNTPNDENIILTSSDPSKLLLSTDPTVAGTNSVTITVPAGSGSSPTPVYAQALVGTGTASITASSADYSSTTVAVNLLPSGFVLSANFNCIGNSAFSTTPLSTDVGLTVYLTPLDPTTLNDTSIYNNCYQIPQMLAPAAGTVTIPINSSNAGVGSITVTPLTFNPGDSQQSSAFHAVANGSSTISLGTPSVPFNTPSNYQSLTATVTNGSINISVGTMGEVGNNLQAPVTASLSVPTSTSGDTVTITSSDPTKLLLSVDPTVAGTASISIPVAPNSTSVSTFYAQALAGAGSVTLTASAASFDPQSVNVPLVPSGFVQFANCNVGNNPISTSVLAGDSATGIYSVPLDPTTLNLVDIGYCLPNAQALRPGVADVSVNVTSSNTAVGTITTSPVVFTTNQMSASTSFHPVANGTTNVSVGTPTGFSPPSNYQVTTYNVVPAPIYAPAVSVGRNMQVATSISLGVAAPSGGLAVTISSPNANVLFSTSPATLGSTSLTFNLNAGDTSTPNFYVQAKFAAPASVTYTASAPQYATTTANISVLPSGFALYDGNAPSFTTTVGTADVSLQVVPVSLDPNTLNVVDFETLLPGSSSINTQVPVLTSPTCGGALDQTVGQITVSPVVFNGDDSPNYQNTSFHAVATGSTVVYVGVPSSNYSRASNYNCLTGNVN